MTERSNELIIGRTPRPIAHAAGGLSTNGINPMETSTQGPHYDGGVSRESATQGSDSRARLAGRVEFSSGLGHHVVDPSHS